MSGNPGGRPAGLKEVVELACSHAPAAIETLAEIARNGRPEMARIAAAGALLDRGYGKLKLPEIQTVNRRPKGALPHSWCRWEAVAHAAWMSRARSRSSFARPYICRFSSSSFVICPSTWPLLQSCVSAARTAASSCFSPAANDRNALRAYAPGMQPPSAASGTPTSSSCHRWMATPRPAKNLSKSSRVRLAFSWEETSWPEGLWNTTRPLDAAVTRTRWPPFEGGFRSGQRIAW